MAQSPIIRWITTLDRLQSNSYNFCIQNLRVTLILIGLKDIASGLESLQMTLCTGLTPTVSRVLIVRPLCEMALEMERN